MSGAARATVDLAGGVIDSGSPNVFVDGSPAARVGDPVHNHGIGAHASATIQSGSTTVICNGLQMARKGDPATCGDTIAGGSSDVLVGGVAASSAFVGVPMDTKVIIAPSDQAAVNSQMDTYTEDQKPQLAYDPSQATRTAVYNDPVLVLNDAPTPYPGSLPPTNPTGDSVAPLATAPESDIPAWLNARLAEADNWGRADKPSPSATQPSNPNIVGIWISLGFPDQPYWRTDVTPWCMGTVNFALKSCGYRYRQEASARAITTNYAAWGATQIPIDQGVGGDIVFWNYGHVNFILSAGGPGGVGPPYVFCGGNQSGKQPGVSHPSGWSGITKAWPSGWKIGSSNDLGGIYRPVKA